MARLFTWIGGIFIAGGLVFTVIGLLRGELAQAGLAFVFGVGGGILQVLWSHFAAEADQADSDDRLPQGSTWRHWLSDVLIITVLGVAFAAEVFMHDAEHPYALVIIGVPLAAVVFFHYVRLRRLAGHPKLWQALLPVLERSRFVFAGTSGIAAGAAIGVPAELPKLAFFEVASQLIPVLALVLAVEGRIYALARGADPGRLVIVIQTFAAMGVGEYICLRAIALASIGSYDLAIVGGVLVMTFVSIVLLAILGPVSVEAEAPGDT